MLDTPSSSPTDFDPDAELADDLDEHERQQRRLGVDEGVLDREQAERQARPDVGERPSLGRDGGHARTSYRPRGRSARSVRHCRDAGRRADTGDEDPQEVRA